MERSVDFKPVQRRLLIPLALGTVALTSAFCVAMVVLQRVHQEHQTQAILDSTSYSLDTGLGEQIEELGYILKDLSHLPGLESCIAERDRACLVRLLAPALDALHDEELLTHLYVHGPDRINLARVHDPERHGDRIDRASLREAERTGEIAAALELGTLGLLTLRVVLPLERRDGDRLGYLELGKDLSAVLEEVSERHHIQHIFLVNKALVRRPLLAEGMRLLGRELDWDQFDEVVATHSSFLEGVPAQMARLATEGAGTDRIDFAGRPWQTLRYPLGETSDGPVGDLFILQDMSEQQAEFRTLLTLVLIGSAVVVCGLFALFYVWLSRVDVVISEQQRELIANASELLKHRDHLEELVEARTQELVETQRNLRESSRLAGMAEVATGVLHNIGNILTAANASIEVLVGQVQRSRVEGVTKTAALLAGERADLPAFFAPGGRGERIPEYLKKLSDQLRSEREATLEELQTLRSCVGTIKEAVAVQQSIARVAGVKERVEPDTLLTDVLAMMQHALVRHDIVVERDFDASERVAVDRARVVQILANLIENAIHAMRASEAGGGHRLRLSTLLRDDRLHVSVEDNGVGIEHQNLTKVFAYGFTTRPGGHGFGLHHSANAATEMGGRLWAESEGPGRGATFHLEVPVEEGGEKPE